MRANRKGWYVAQSFWIIGTFAVRPFVVCKPPMLAKVKELEINSGQGMGEIGGCFVGSSRDEKGTDLTGGGRDCWGMGILGVSLGLG